MQKLCLLDVAGKFLELAAVFFKQFSCGSEVASGSRDRCSSVAFGMMPAGPAKAQVRSTRRQSREQLSQEQLREQNSGL